MSSASKLLWDYAHYSNGIDYEVKKVEPPTAALQRIYKTNIVAKIV